MTTSSPTKDPPPEGDLPAHQAEQAWDAEFPTQATLLTQLKATLLSVQDDDLQQEMMRALTVF